MVRVALALVVVGSLAGCGLFARDPKVPEGQAWREEVVTALETTPGVTSPGEFGYGNLRHDKALWEATH